MSERLPRESVEQYRRDGFFFPVRVLSPAERDSASLVRGVDRYGHFDSEQPPAHDLAPEAVARHAAIMKRQGEILYRGTTAERFR